MKNKKIISIVMLLGLSACQTMPYKPYARDVKKKPNQGGIIALKPEHNPEDRAKAESMMTQACGNTGYKILEEGEVAVGQESVSNGSTSKDAGSKGSQVGSLFGIPVVSGGSNPTDTTSSKTSTVAIKEWQISYECEKSKGSTVK